MPLQPRFSVAGSGEEIRTECENARARGKKEREKKRNDKKCRNERVCRAARRRAKLREMIESVRSIDATETRGGEFRSKIGPRLIKRKQKKREREGRKKGRLLINLCRM